MELQSEVLMKRKPNIRSLISKGFQREDGFNPASAKSIAEQYFDLQRLRRRVRLAEISGADGRHRVANGVSPLTEDSVEH